MEHQYDNLYAYSHACQSASSPRAVMPVNPPAAHIQSCLSICQQPTCSHACQSTSSPHTVMPVNPPAAHIQSCLSIHQQPTCSHACQSTSPRMHTHVRMLKYMYTVHSLHSCAFTVCTTKMSEVADFTKFNVI